MLPSLILSALVPSFIKGSFTHLSTFVRIIFQLSEIRVARVANSKMVITTAKIANIFELLVDTILVALYELSLLIFLTTPRNRHYYYSYFQMRTRGREGKEQLKTIGSKAVTALPKRLPVIQGQSTGT